MKLLFNAAFLALAQILAMTEGASAAGCNLQLVVALDMDMTADGHQTVPVGINGKSYNFMVDTGGVVSMISPQIVDALGLPKKPSAISLRGVGNFGTKPLYVSPDDFSLGSLHGSGFKFFIAGVGESDGVLAPDILRNYDVDFDPAAGKLRLIAQNDCTNPVYWTQDPAAALSMYIDRGHEESKSGRRFADGDADTHIRVPVSVDGHSINAILDTGAENTILSTSTAAFLGITSDRYGEKQQARINGMETDVYHYTAKVLDFGGVQVQNAQIEIYPDKAFDLPNQLLVGGNILRQVHMLIDYKAGKVYMTAPQAH